MRARAPDIRLVTRVAAVLAPESADRVMIPSLSIKVRAACACPKKNQNRAEPSKDGTPRGTTLVPHHASWARCGPLPLSRWVSGGCYSARLRNLWPLRLRDESPRQRILAHTQPQLSLIRSAACFS